MYYTIIFIILMFIFIKKNDVEKWKNIQNDSYFSFFNQNDFRLRNCNNIKECKESYSDSEINLTPFEKKKVKQVCNKLINKIPQYKFIFNDMAIIKVNNSLENSMPHTRKKYIILSSRWIDRFSEGENLVIDRLLSHEQFHIYQRYNPKKMENFYSQFWNMEKFKKPLPKEILDLNRTNPDALPDINWLFKRKNDLILPLCLYRKNASSLNDTENIYIRMDKSHNFIDLVDDLENRKLLMNEPNFRKFFGDEMSNNYHANELSASLFEIIVEDEIFNKKEERPEAYHKMKEFLDSEN
jgi:hypothetical protein